MKTAQFSNGSTDTYKGTRDVQAAWAIISPEGHTIMSGHSMDRAKAEKTARGNLRYCTGGTVIPVKPGSYPMTSEDIARQQAYAVSLGYADRKACYAGQMAKINAYRASMKIEVVDL